MEHLDERMRRVLSLHGGDGWRDDLERLKRGDTTLTRQTAGEAAIKALQRLLIFLGYSTAASGAFLIDGDFGRGTNRGVAQFQFEQKLNARIRRRSLCYPCTFRTAKSNITAIPKVTLTLRTLEKMIEAATAAISNRKIPFGDFKEALFHLNSLDQRQSLDCRQIMARYGDAVYRAVATVAEEKGIKIAPEWILAIIRQETAGVSRPRFEQHKLSKFNDKEPTTPLAELRVRSMSFGLGQIMGFNYQHVGALSAEAMFYSPLQEQILFIARFIAPKQSVVSKTDPTMPDFEAMARFYNGPAYAKHFYHERLQRWFREFRRLN
jgi:hypothetical protein